MNWVITDKVNSHNFFFLEIWKMIFFSRSFLGTWPRSALQESVMQSLAMIKFYTEQKKIIKWAWLKPCEKNQMNEMETAAAATAAVKMDAVDAILYGL